eukprot:TRINITY_DN49817_c0_g1_i1.p1 TRINITY_DN49817_c0_g1~~TRINITY_DN49817_c0_g1_i1.p1  ORF type:complete len:546 (+),score=129.14 TRINITY_DN49817_c0_g1_i1:113-1750(+)
MIRRPPRSTLSSSSAASDVYKRQGEMWGKFAEAEDGDEMAPAEEAHREVRPDDDPDMRARAVQERMVTFADQIQQEDESASTRARGLTARERRISRRDAAQYLDVDDAGEGKPAPSQAKRLDEREAADSWESINSILKTKQPLNDLMPADGESLPIMEIDSSAPDEPIKEGGTASLLRRLIAADLVLGKPIQKLDLGGHGVGDDSCAAIAEALKVGAKVEVLDLRNNSISDKGAAVLASAMEVCPTLHHVVLSNNRIGTPGATALASALKYNPCIEEWDLSDNCIGDEGLFMFAQGLLVNSSLTVLSLRHTMLDDLGCVALDRFAWGGQSQLTELDLSGNQFGLQGCTTIGKMLSRSSCLLTVLDLRDNQIGDDGACLIARGLAQNTTMRLLSFARCMIGDRGMCAIADTVTNQSAMRSLILKDNLLGEAGCLSLASAIKRSEAVLLLDLTNNPPITEAGVNVLILALREVDKDRKIVVHFEPDFVIRGKAMADKIPLFEEVEREGMVALATKEPETPGSAVPPIARVENSGCGRVCSNTSCSVQ